MKLDGLKVLDLSAFLPGPHMTMMMADHGADVIMIEPANGLGEPVREIGEKAADGVSVWFRNISRGKRSLKLNLKDPDALAAFYKLAAEVDVVVEAFRPGVVQRLGVDYETLRGINPGIVYCSISAFGQDSSLARKPAHDLTVQGMAGLVDLNRGQDDQPAMPSIPFADASASLMALSAILMALYRRSITGEGDFIDLSMYDAAIAWTPNVLGPTFGEGRAPAPKEMRSFGGSAMYNLYKTSDDEFIILGGSEVKFAANLLKAFNREDLLGYAHEVPGPAQQPLRDFFTEEFSKRPLEWWKAFLKDVDCCWSWVRSLKDSFDDPFTEERQMVFTDDDGNRHIGPAIKFAQEPASPNPAVPSYGQHSVEILKSLNISDDDIAALIQKGAI